MTFVIPTLKGGLGNQLFILAYAYAFAKRNGFKMKISSHFIETQNIFKHSSLDYLSSIFRNILICHNHHDEEDTIILNNYFQDYQQFHLYYNDIQCLFWLPPVMFKSKQNLQYSCFIHFRKTDFLDPDASGIHNVLDSFTNYYENCIQHVLFLYPNCEFIVFSDDIETTLENHDHIFQHFGKMRFIMAPKSLNELDTLAIMQACGIGGIAANSTFSWWGLYLNIHRPIMMIPNTFFHNIEMNHDGYYFPGCIIKYI